MPSPPKLEILSRKDKPCVLKFNKGENVPTETKRSSNLKKLSSSSATLLDASSNKKCQAIKSDGKKCTFKAKCFSKSRGKYFCGVHNKYCFE